MLFRTLWNLEHARLGFDVTRVTSFSSQPADATGFGNMSVSEETQQKAPSIATEFYQPVLQRLKSMPGFEDAALITAPPFLRTLDWVAASPFLGKPEESQRDNQTSMTAVSGGYTHVMSTPSFAARMIDENDTASTSYVAVANEAFVHKYFHDEEPLGRQLDLGGKDTGMLKPYTIVGVIGDQIDHSAAAPARPMLFLSYQQVPMSSLFYPALLKTVVFFVVKTRGDIAVAPVARTAFKQVAPDFAIDNFSTMRESLAQSNFNDRLGLYLIGTFAGWRF